MTAAKYMPCQSCGAGAMTWSEEEGTSTCSYCGAVYTRTV